MKENQRILLVEPKTRTTYPPLGLMKIATYHRLIGDEVQYISGKNKKACDEWWDKIYITSVFTYDFDNLVDTIKYYRKNLANIDNVYVGGIAATLLAERLFEETGIYPHLGLLDQSTPALERAATTVPELAYLDQCCPSIDNLPPDYSIFGTDAVRYSKMLDESYLFFATKGCPNNCSFCAVKTLEPSYVRYIPLAPRIDYIAKRWGEKSGLVLLDNNIAASDSYDRIIDEIRDCGFGVNEKLKLTRNGRTIYKQRFVDFNQGVDLRRMDRQKLLKMATIAIKPLRLAFDDISLAKEYEKKARLAIDCGICNLSNYMLFNFNDTPQDLYKRFDVNMNILRDNPHAKIFSFPMRYSPVTKTDRSFVGKHWTRREIRAIQIILNATHGIVSHKSNFFHHAFGNDVEHFKRIILYPYHYIINREHYETVDKKIDDWEYEYAALSVTEISELRSLLANGVIDAPPKATTAKLKNILLHYSGEHSKVIKGT